MEQFANLYSSTLASSYTAGAASISVTSATGAPSSGTFTLVIRDPATKTVKLLFRVTAVSGTTFTGAAEGADANASSADLVDGTMVTAAALNQIQTDWSGQVPLVAPVSANWTQLNAGAMTYVNTASSMYMAIAENALQVRGYVKTAPSVGAGGIWRCTFGFRVAAIVATFSYLGCGFKENSSGRLVTFGPETQTIGNLYGANWNSISSFSTNLTAIQVSHYPPICWLRLRYDGTNIQSQWSPDGVNFVTVSSQAKAAFFTTAPDQIVLFICGNTAMTIPQQQTLIAYQEESL